MQISTEPILALTKKLRSALQTRRKLHLSQDEISILLHPEIYNAISRLEAEALRNACALATANDNSWGIITCGGDPLPELGAFVGSNAAETELLARGARLRVSEAATKVTRRGKPSTP